VEERRLEHGAEEGVVDHQESVPFRQVRFEPLPQRPEIDHVERGVGGSLDVDEREVLCVAREGLVPAAVHDGMAWTFHSGSMWRKKWSVPP
jgi:hypothetical protein